MKLALETKNQKDKGRVNGNIAITPPINEEYWMYRVAVADNQAIIAFPKFFTIGVGFQHEEDWNTNLPASSEAEAILNHIWHNRGKGNNGDEFRRRCLDAIRLIQAEVEKLREELKSKSS